MQVITQAEYIALSDFLASAKATLLTAKTQAFSAVEQIAQYDDVTPSIDLLSAFFASYEAVTANAQSTSSLNAAVSALNNHVLRRTRDTLDKFLTATGVPGGPYKVDPIFADLSRNLGFQISDENIATGG
jgi:hypothetical protein